MSLENFFSMIKQAVTQSANAVKPGAAGAVSATAPAPAPSGGTVHVRAHMRDGYRVNAYERSAPGGGAGDSGDANDILGIKRILQKLGFYEPELRSETEGKLHEYANGNYVRAITNFQKAHGIPATGTVNALTRDALNGAGGGKSANIGMSDGGVENLIELEGDIPNQIKKGSYKDGIFYVHNDGAGIPTIGYGHRLKPGESFPNGITETQAEDLLRQDIKTAQDDYVKLIGRTDYSQKKIDAIISFLYNTGRPNVVGSNTIYMLKHNLKVHPKSGKTLEQEFKEFRKSNGRVIEGLENRRKTEWEWMETGNFRRW